MKRIAWLPSLAALGLIASPVLASPAAPAASKLADSRDKGHAKGDKGKDRPKAFADKRDRGHVKGDKRKDRPKAFA